MKTKLVLLSAAMVLLLCSCGLLPQEKQRQDAPVLEEYAVDPYTYVSVQRGSVVNVVSGSAAVVAVESQTLSFVDTEREIDACLVALGDRVSSGDVLCTLKAEDLSEQLVELQTQLALQELELDYRRSSNALDLEREQILLSRMTDEAQKTAKRTQIDSLKREYEAQEQALQVQLQELQAQYAQIQLQYEQCSLVAQMDGTVTKLSADHRTIEISDLSECVLEITKNDAKEFPAGTRVQLQNEQQVQTGTVMTAEQAGRQDSSGMFILPDEPGSFAGTTRWSISYVAAEADDVLYLPDAALRVADGKDCVYILGADGLITTLDVTVGISGGGYTQIVSGLEEGQQVILKY